MDNMYQKKISIIVSVFNEEQVLKDFYQEIKKVLDSIQWKYELIFVNDGSSDSSGKILKEIAQKDSNICIINFSRNFGHEAAMIAGIDYSNGDGVICMDADLQHPPQYIKNIIKKFEDGYDIVNMVRTKNKSAGLLKNVTSLGFYKLINIISDAKMEENASDFFALSSQVVDVMKKSYRMKTRFLRGYIQNIGFDKTTIEYEAGDRVAGHSKYNINKLFKFALNTIFCFSDFPLKISSYMSALFCGFGILELINTIYRTMIIDVSSKNEILITIICFSFSIVFILISILGKYISIMFEEIKDKPIYIVKDKNERIV